MKAIIMSIQPKWCEKIANGEKTIEVRKTRPKLETPFKCYMYCTFPQKPVYDIWINRGTENRFLGNGKVIGEFVCDRCSPLSYFGIDDRKATCLSEKEIQQYGSKGSGYIYGWHISELKIYDKPKELGEFYRSLPEKVLEEGDYDCRKDWDVLCLDAPEGSEYCAVCPYGGRVQITRPPRSWCYVEELED